MAPFYFNRRPPTYSTEPAPPYREIPLPPPYPKVQSPEYLNEKFRYFYLYKKKDGWMSAVVEFLAKNKDYTFELRRNDQELCIILPDNCFMSMELEELLEIRTKAEAAVKKGKLLKYWEIDKIKNWSAEDGLIKAKVRADYQKRLDQDELFRSMEATKTASAISKELSRRVMDFVHRI